MKKSLFTFGVALLAAAATSAHATLIVNEPFEYSTGGLGSSAVTGDGLTGNWSGNYNSGTFSTAAGGTVISSWSYTPPTNYAPAPSFNQYDAGGGTQNSYAQLSSSLSTSSDATYYISYFYQVGTAGNVASSYAQAGLTSTAANNLDYFNVGKTSTGTTFGVKFGTDATEDTGVSLAADTAYFVVLKLDILGSGTDSLSFKAYTSADTLPVTEPITWDYTATAALSGSFNGIGFRNGSGQTDFKSDEFRLGTTWSSVTVPEPTTAVLLAGSLASLALLRRRRS